MSGEKRTRTVAVEPEHEITAELTREEEVNGESRTTIDEATLREEGAMNAEAAQSNRRRAGASEKKRGGAQRVPWGETRATLLYDDILNYWGADTLRVVVERQGDNPVTWELNDVIKDGQNLYQVIMVRCHRRNPETKYRVVFRDRASRLERGIGYIMMPSTMEDPLPPGQAATPSAFGGPPWQQPPWQQQPPQWQPPPWQQQQQQPPPQQAPAQPAPAAQQQPPPPPSVSPEMLMWIGQQMGQLPQQLQQQFAPFFSQLQSILQHPAQSQPPAPRARSGDGRFGVVPPGPSLYAQPQLMQQPARPPPPADGMLYVEGLGWVPTVKLLEALGHISPQPQQQPPPVQQQTVPAPVQPLKSAADQFRESIGLLTYAADALQSVRTILPTTEAAAATVASKPEEESPVKTLRLGDTNVIVNSKDGSTRLIETGLANMDKIMGWADKIHQRSIQFQREQQAQASGQPPPQPLPQQPTQQQQGGVLPMPQWPGRNP